MFEVTFGTDMQAVINQFSELLKELGCEPIKKDILGYTQLWASSLFFGERDSAHQFHGSRAGGQTWGWYVQVYWTSKADYNRSVPDRPFRVQFGTVDAMGPHGHRCDHEWTITLNGLQAPCQKTGWVRSAHAEAGCWCALPEYEKGMPATVENIARAWNRLVAFMLEEYQQANAQAKALRQVMDFGKDTRISAIKQLAEELRRRS